MGRRSRKRSRFPPRFFRKKLPSDASPKQIEEYYERRDYYFRMLRGSISAAWAREKDLRDPAHWPRQRHTHNWTKPNGWKTVWYTRNDRKR